MPKLGISIVVLSYNRDDIIISNLENLDLIASKNPEINIEILVVDNNSTDSTRVKLDEERWQSNVRLIYNDSNYGVAKGRNIGILESQNDWVLILDDDSILSKDAFARLIEFLNQIDNKSIGLIGLNVIDMNSKLSVSDSILDHKKLSNFHGAGHLINKDLVKSIGLLDEKCTFGGEELDYSIRCRKAGFKLIFAKDVEVNHYCKVRNDTDGLERRYRWLFNYTRVIFKHLPFQYAVIYSFRYLIGYLYSCIKVFGFFTSSILFKSYIIGSYKGRSVYKKTKNTELDFYFDENNRPEYGNVSLLKKIKNRN